MLVIPVVAWGNHFVESAHRLLRSLQSPGNIPDVETRIIIYTDAPERFSGLEAVRINTKTHSKHLLTSGCYTQSLAFGHPIVPLAADMIASEGLLWALERAGKDADLIVCPVLRAQADRFLPELPREGPISLSPRTLCALALKHAHPRQALQYLENLPARSQPTTIYRRQGGTVLARCFHMHPLLIRAPLGTILPEGIDRDHVGTVAMERTHVVTDSDELMVVDISERDYKWEPDYQHPLNPLEWARGHTKSRHRWFFSHECYLHAGEREVLPHDTYCDKLLAALNA